MSENSSNGPTPGEPSGASGASDEPQAATVAREVEELERRSQTAARLFDVRRIIGGLFVVYGVIVTVAGVFASKADIEKAENVNINLWTGLAMLVLGVAFLVWLKMSPTIPPPATNEADNGESGSTGSTGSTGGETPPA